jgi:hypothetical protein
MSPISAVRNDEGSGRMIYSLHFIDTRSENVHSFVAKLEHSIHARLVCPSGEILVTQFAEHVRIRKGHEQLSVPCDDIHGQKQDEGTSVCLECNADHLMKIQMKIIGRVVVASNKIGYEHAFAQ